MDTIEVIVLIICIVFLDHLRIPYKEFALLQGIFRRILGRFFIWPARAPL